MQQPSDAALSSAFTRHRPEAAADPDAVSAALRALWDEAQDAWPELEVDPPSFMAFLAERVPADAALPEALDALRPGDLLLCFGCLQGDATALTAFDADYLAVIRAALRRMELASSDIDEIRQQLSTRLLVGTKEAGPRLDAYSGRGDLRNWVRTAAVRLAQNHLAARVRGARESDGHLERAVASGPDPDLAVLQRQYGQLFAACFEAAVTDLTPKERNLLRLSFVEGMTSDGLGSLHGVHRATAARWVASARDRLSARTRRRMMDRLQIGRRDLQSILRLIHSQLDVSVRRCLTTDADDA